VTKIGRLQGVAKLTQYTTQHFRQKQRKMKGKMFNGGISFQ
jgi:hypothetical protein